MKILLCGEGKHDYGGQEDEGWLQPVLRNLLDLAEPVSFGRISRSELFGFAKPRLKGHGEKARLAYRVARRENYDAVVFMADADTKLVKEWRRNYCLLRAGFPDAGIPIGIACFPKSASESWLLTDAQAWAGLGLADRDLMPQKPEKLWGARSDPSGNHPKHVFRRVCTSAGWEDGTEIRREVASLSRADELSRLCELSFVPFRKDVERLRVSD
jgi:hypothetical protein